MSSAKQDSNELTVRADEIDSALERMREMSNLYPAGTLDMVMVKTAEDFTNTLKALDTPYAETLVTKWEAWIKGMRTGNVHQPTKTLH